MKNKSQNFTVVAKISSILFICIFTLISCEKENLEIEENPIQSSELEGMPSAAQLKCGGYGFLLNYELVNAMSADQIKAALGPAFAPLVQNGVEMYKVTYMSQFNGQFIPVSGVVGVPDAPIDHNTPVVMYNHGTRVTPADLIPSSGMDLLSVAAAANGKICFSADYVGYGESNEYFPPYLVRDENIYPVVDMIIAGRYFLFYEHGIYQKPNLTMFGYSQGGHVTMAVQKFIENNWFYQHVANIQGVAMGTGPYDLYENMMYPVVAGESYPGTAYIVFILLSYNEYYDLGYEMDELFQNGYGQLFLDLKSANKTFSEINAELPAEIAQLLNPEFREDFLEEDTDFNELLIENSTYADWFPISKTRIYHSRNDEIVPYASAKFAYETLIDAGASNLELITYDGLGHVGTAFVSFGDILAWVDSMQ